MDTMMNVNIECNRRASHKVSEMILGQMLDAAADGIPGLLSDRLDNPKFVGPAHPVNGVAWGWEINRAPVLRCELTPGGGLLGREAQSIHRLSGVRKSGRKALRPSAGIVQNKRQIRAGEQLEIEIWAKAWREPVTLVVSIMPSARMLKPYDEARIHIESAHYKRYTVTLTAPVDDNEALFFCGVEEDAASVWIDQIHMRPADEGSLCKELMTRIASLKTPAIRFPGGVTSTVYNWQHGTGPVHLRPVVSDASFRANWYMHYDFGTDEYLEMCLEQNITPVITINVGTGTPDEAEGWAAYCVNWYRCRNVEPPLIHWHIGNHPYNPMDFMAAMTEEMYLNTLREFIPAVRKGYPNCRIVVPLVAHRKFPTPWNELLLDEAGDMIDIVAVQRYGTQGVVPPDSNWSGGTKDGRKQIISMLKDIDNCIEPVRGVIRSCRSRGLKMNVTIAEWSYWCQASIWDGENFLEPHYVLHGLFAAGMLNSFARLGPDLEMANFYHLVNQMGMFIHRGADVEETCMPEIFRIYRPAFPGEFLPLEIDSPSLGRSQAVDGICMKNSKGTWLLLSNRHESKAARISMRNIGGKPAEITMLTGDGPLGQFQKNAGEINIDNPELPPLSIARFHYL